MHLLLVPFLFAQWFFSPISLIVVDRERNERHYFFCCLARIQPYVWYLPYEYSRVQAASQDLFISLCKKRVIYHGLGSNAKTYSLALFHGVLPL